MRLSPLQSYILRFCYSAKSPRVNRTPFSAFYSNPAKRPADITDVITKSLERLIGRGLLVGYGERTAEKWFIRDVRLTPAGRRTAKSLFGRQQRLKF